jgi:multidrug efflux pump subunit AcrA (membrane-fusion protein)
MTTSGAKAESAIVRPAGFTSGLSSMDVARPDLLTKKRKRRIITISAAALAVVLTTVALSRLKPAVPSVDRSTVWIDTVKRGPIVRQVRGLGTLVTEEIRWIPANTEGRVEKIIVRPRDSIEPQLASKQAAVDQAKQLAKLKLDQVDALHVRAGMSGVLQQLAVEIGQRVKVADNLARVADPTKLKAQVKIAETQAKDIQIDQQAVIDTRNGVAKGHVTRVDPAVEQGTVTVDVAFDEPFPDGARPDLSVDGTVQLERLDDVVYVGRPVFGQENNTVGIFKLVSGSSDAVRTPVKLGKSSVNTIEILDGLQPGDQVILSDTSAWETRERIRLK